jgi:DNA-binding MarR family transcriptional regulator
MKHPSAELDDVVHQRTRLGVLAMLKEAHEIDFSTLREHLDVTDGSLSQHIRVLEAAGYVEVRKGYEGRRPRTWLKITKSGSRALSRELRLLRQIVAVEAPDAPVRPRRVRPQPATEVV